MEVSSMNEIIAVLITAGCGLAWNLFGMKGKDLIADWASGKPSKGSLWSSYYAALLLILLLNLLIMLFRSMMVEYAGESFFPTYINRTPPEWFTAAVIGSVSFWLLICVVLNSIYNYLHDRSYIGSPRFKKAFLRLSAFYLLIFFITGGYQLYFYWWDEWGLSKKFSALHRFISCLLE